MRSPVPPPVDVVIAAAFVVLTVAEAVLGSAGPWPGFHVALGAGSMAALAWRRAFPVEIAVLVVLSNLVVNPEGEFSTLLSLVLVAFTIGAETRPPRSHVGLAVVVLPFLGGIAAEGLQPSDLAAAIVFLVGPWWLGALLRQRSNRMEEAVARVTRLEEERERHAAQAAVEERTRIARELHDIVSHSISVVTIQTQAVRRRLHSDQVREAEDLAAVEATAREALAEMRRLFGVLRSDRDEVSLAPQPGLNELDRLVSQVRASGLAVEIEVHGEPYDLPPGVDLAAYRVVQEALTNALRHSGASLVRVELGYGGAGLDLAVEDDGRGVVNTRAGGHGLVGIRERVALYGGSVDVGARPTGGVRLVARLPVGEQA